MISWRKETVMTNDMTKGSPVRLILSFMIPTYLGNIFQQFYNLVDSIVAGRYIGVNALAAIGSTASLIFLVIGWLNGITSGFAIMVAQSFGAKDYRKMRHYIAMSILLCFGFVVVMTGGLLVLNVPILRLNQYTGRYYWRYGGLYADHLCRSVCDRSLQCFCCSSEGVG